MQDEASLPTNGSAAPPQEQITKDGEFAKAAPAFRKQRFGSAIGTRWSYVDKDFKISQQINTGKPENGEDRFAEPVRKVGSEPLAHDPHWQASVVSLVIH